jgi:hypothetical protein
MPPPPDSLARPLKGALRKLVVPNPTRHHGRRRSMSTIDVDHCLTRHSPRLPTGVSSSPAVSPRRPDPGRPRAASRTAGQPAGPASRTQRAAPGPRDGWRCRYSRTVAVGRRGLSRAWWSLQDTTMYMVPMVTPPPTGGTGRCRGGRPARRRQTAPAWGPARRGRWSCRACVRR